MQNSHPQSHRSIRLPRNRAQSLGRANVKVTSSDHRPNEEISRSPSNDESYSEKHDHVIQNRANSKSHGLSRASSRSRDGNPRSGSRTRGADGPHDNRGCKSIKQSDSRRSGTIHPPSGGTELLNHQYGGNPRPNIRSQTIRPCRDSVTKSGHDHGETFLRESYATMGVDGQIKRSSSTENTSSASGAEKCAHDEKLDCMGRCINHPTIELRRWEAHNDAWRILLQDCPLCSFDDPNNNFQRKNSGAYSTSGKKLNIRATAVSNTKLNKKKENDSTETATTFESNSEEEASVRSWTVSDASSSEAEDEPISVNRRAVLSKQPLKQRAPPPPKRPENSSKEATDKGANQSRPRKQPTASVQSLKKLGRQLVMESEAANFASSVSKPSTPSSRPRNAPPPPPSRNLQPTPIGISKSSSVKNETYNESFNDLNSSNNKIGGGKTGVGERRRSSTASLTSMSAKEISELRRQRIAAKGKGFLRQNVTPNKNNDLDNAGSPSKIATKEIKPNQEASSDDILKAAAEARLKARGNRRCRKKIVQEALEAADFSPGESSPRSAMNQWAPPYSKRSESVERQESNEANAVLFEAKNDTQSNHPQLVRRGRQKDVFPECRDEPMNDILAAAAQIRSRAKRSVSRSRERVRAAALFCGDTPLVDDDDSDDDCGGNADIKSTGETKRTILNPHGLSQQPQPPSMERRSQSRGKEREGTFHEQIESIERNEQHRRRSTSRKRGENRRQKSPACQNASPGDEEQSEFGANSTSTGESDGVEDSTPTRENGESPAHALISRRREMRQQIADRMNSKKGYRRGDSSGSGVQDFRKDIAQDDYSNPGRSRNDHKNERRQGRSRSLMRDSFSKIRSSSLSAFRKKSDGNSKVNKEEVSEDGSMCSDSRSRGSFIQRFSKSKGGRSLSRGKAHSIVDNGSLDGSEGWDAQSNAKSECLASTGTKWDEDDIDNRSSRSSITNRFSKDRKTRSRSRGRVQNQTFDEDGRIDVKSECGFVGRSDSSLSLLTRMSRIKNVRSISRGKSRTKNDDSLDVELDASWDATRSENFATILNHSEDTVGFGRMRNNVANHGRRSFGDWEARSVAQSDSFVTNRNRSTWDSGPESVSRLPLGRTNPFDD